MNKFMLGTKGKMTQVFDEKGVVSAATLVSAGPLTVSQVKTTDKDGYTAVQIGVGKAKVKNVSQAMRGHFAKAKVEPKQKLVEFWRKCHKKYVLAAVLYNTRSSRHRERFQKRLFGRKDSISFEAKFCLPTLELRIPNPSH